MVGIKKGFTLIEILIVAVIIGMLAVYAIPQFFKFNKRQATEEQTRILEDGFLTAQTLALSGVQNTSTKVDRYRFSLLRGVGDSGVCYRGYSVQGIDVDDNAIGPVLEKEAIKCPLVIESSWEAVDIETITGKLLGVGDLLATATRDIRLCFPDLGYSVVTISAQGKTNRGEFINFGSAEDTIGSCTCTACNPLP